MNLYLDEDSCGRSARDDEEVIEIREIWALNDFDDLIHQVQRPTLYPLGDEEFAYPS
jgi:hypothetical protein